VSLKRLILLGAGRGSRLGLPSKTSKLRLRLHGQSLARRLVRRYFRAGVQRATVVLPKYWGDLDGGFDGMVDDEAVTIVENTVPERGNGFSLLLALRGTEEGRVLVAMGDHFFEDSVAEEMVDLLHASRNRLAVEPCEVGCARGRRVEEATKVRLDASDGIVALGKGLRTWNGVDMGIFVVNVDVQDVLEELLRGTGRATMTQLVRAHTRMRHPFLAKTFGDVEWFDIDTEEDLGLVEEMLEA